MYWIVPLILLSNVFLGTSYQRLVGCPQSGQRLGEFSQDSVDLCFQDEDNERRNLEMSSPDHSVLLKIDGQEGRFYSGGHEIGPAFKVARDVEIIWSPDSRAVIFTLSLGAAGPVAADFGVVHGPSSAADIALTERIRRDFASHHLKDKCHEEVNVAGLTWLDGSARAVLIAEVPPSPQCTESGGYFEAYIVSFPNGQILERCSMKETIRRWRKVFGPRLKGDIDLLKDR
jgi:hypothetical protein